MPTQHKLAFRRDGTFTIVQITDLHYGADALEDERTIAGMKTVFAIEKPDLIVFTGDIVKGNACTDQQGQFLEALSVPDKLGIPFALVFGNHDSEHKMCTRKEMMEAAIRLPLCYAQSGPAEVSGVGNYVLTINGASVSSSKALLYFFDSETGANGFHYDQIRWYIDQAVGLRDGDNGQPHPALAFFHRPLPEYNDVWNFHSCSGGKYEIVDSSKLNSGMFSAMKQMGDVVGVFVGHNHLNDYCGKFHDISLCYGRAGGHNMLGEETYPRGARVIRLREGMREFETWIRMADGTVMQQPEHKPTGQPAAAVPKDVAKFSVMSFNICASAADGGAKAWSKRKHLVADVIERNWPTVVGVQQCPPGILHDLAEEIPRYGWSGYGESADRGDGDNGILYLKSVLNMVESGRFYLNESIDETDSGNRAAAVSSCVWSLFAFVSHPHKRFLACNTSLDEAGQSGKEHAIRRIWERVNGYAERLDVPIVLIGDLNSEPNSSVIRFLRGQIELDGISCRMTDSYSQMSEAPGITKHDYTGGREGEPTDYIFASPSLTIRRSKVIRDPFYEAHPSGHYPLKSSIHYE